MSQRIYQIDAFTSKVFSGNPAAVCPLDRWLPDDVMQKIAMENNLAETAFFVKKGEHYELRWFTPAVEVDLCGHATLAAAYVLFHHENHRGDVIDFFSPRSGKLTVTRKGKILTLNFPADQIAAVEVSDHLRAGFDTTPQSAFRGKTDYMLVFANEGEVARLTPDFSALSRLSCRGIIVTAQGDSADFVSRFFAPAVGINEDPVTGSAHTTLTPYWSNQLGKKELTAVQLSGRKGYLTCKLADQRVEISGEARLYMVGEIFMD